jgi:hypothetical protein
MDNTDLVYRLSARMHFTRQCCEEYASAIRPCLKSGKSEVCTPSSKSAISATGKKLRGNIVILREGIRLIAQHAALDDVMNDSRAWLATLLQLAHSLDHFIEFVIDAIEAKARGAWQELRKEIAIFETKTNTLREMGRELSAKKEIAGLATNANGTTSTRPDPFQDARELAKPVWDGSKLEYNGDILKQFKKHPAPNQRKLFDAFQAAGWPDAIQNPWHDPRIQKESVPLKTLNDTLRAINKTISGSVRFESMGDGKCRWVTT